MTMVKSMCKEIGSGPLDKNKKRPINNEKSVSLTGSPEMKANAIEMAEKVEKVNKVAWGPFKGGS